MKEIQGGEGVFLYRPLVMAYSGTLSDIQQVCCKGVEDMETDFELLDVLLPAR